MSVMDKNVMQNEMTIFFSTDSPFLHTHTRENCSNIQDSISYINDNIQLEQMEHMLSVLVMTKFCPNSLTITLGTIAVNI